MGFCAGAKDEVMNNRATFGTVGKFAQLQSGPDSRQLEKCKQALRKSTSIMTAYQRRC